MNFSRILFFISCLFYSFTALAEPRALPCKSEGIYGFSGGTPFPPQLIGSHGPGVFYEYSWKDKRPTNRVADIQLVTGFPNAVDSILWGEAVRYSPGKNIQTAECSMGWGCINNNDPSEIWESGVIFNSKHFNNKSVVFCHIMKLKTENYPGTYRSTLYAWDIYWLLGEPYTCPSTLIDALNGKNKFKDTIHYLVAPNTGTGIANIPSQYWTCKGQFGGAKEIEK